MLEEANLNLHKEDTNTSELHKMEGFEKPPTRSQILQQKQLINTILEKYPTSSILNFYLEFFVKKQDGDSNSYDNLTLEQTCKNAKKINSQ